MPIASLTDEFGASVIDYGGSVVNLAHPAFGAALDGVADDTTPLEDAIEHAKTVGVPLFIPGPVRITATVLGLADSENFRMFGVRGRTIIHTHVPGATSYGFRVGGSIGLQLWGIDFLGTDDADTPSAALINLDSLGASAAVTDWKFRYLGFRFYGNYPYRWNTASYGGEAVDIRVRDIKTAAMLATFTGQIAAGCQPSFSYESAMRRWKIQGVDPTNDAAGSRAVYMSGPAEDFDMEDFLCIGRSIKLVPSGVNEARRVTGRALRVIGGIDGGILLGNLHDSDIEGYASIPSGGGRGVEFGHEGDCANVHLRARIETVASGDGCRVNNTTDCTLDLDLTGTGASLGEGLVIAGDSLRLRARIRGAFTNPVDITAGDGAEIDADLIEVYEGADGASYVHVRDGRAKVSLDTLRVRGLSNSPVARGLQIEDTGGTTGAVLVGRIEAEGTGAAKAISIDAAQRIRISEILSDLSSPLELTSAPAAAVGKVLSGTAFTEVQQVTAAGTVNDLALEDYTEIIRWAPASAATVNGITGGREGRRVLIINSSSQTIMFNHQNAGSAVGNRFGVPDTVSYTLGAREGLEIVYDGTNSIWRLAVPA